MLQVQRTNYFADGRAVVNLGAGTVIYSSGNRSNIIVAGASVLSVEGRGGRAPHGRAHP